MKVYVPVRVAFDTDGNMQPLEISWADGRRYHIDRVTKIRQAAAMRSGGQGDRYTIMVQGKESNLYFERCPDLSGPRLGKWFVESK